MDNFQDDDLVGEIALEVLTRVAPQEIAIFPAASRAYFADKDAALKNLRQGDEVLGFGSSLTVFFTPVVLYVLSEVVDTLARIARKAVEDGVSKEFTAVLQSMFAKFRGPKPDGLSVLTKEQIGLIHAKVVSTATRLKVPAAEAGALANAITAQLVTAQK
jgi:hypothetical protein